MPSKKSKKTKSRKGKKSSKRSVPHSYKKYRYGGYSNSPNRGNYYWVKASSAKRSRGSCRSRRTYPNCASNANCKWTTSKNVSGNYCRSRRGRNIKYGPSLPEGYLTSGKYAGI